MTWDWKCVIFAEDYVGLEGSKPSELKPSWRSHHHRGGGIMSVKRGLWWLAVVGCFVYEPLFSSDLMLNFMDALMILMLEHTHNRHIRGEWRWGRGGGVTIKISCLLWALYWYSSSFYHSLFSALSLFPCRYCVHPSTKSHIFNFDP